MSSLLFIKRLPLVVSLLSSGFVARVEAQTTATTDPVGFITLDIAGAPSSGSSQLSFTGLSLTRAVEYQGAAESVSADSITDNDAVWTEQQFSGPAGAFFVEITSGARAGTTYDIGATSAANKTLTLVQPLAAGIAAGVTYKIRKHWTLASVFGAANEGGLTSGHSASADHILLWNGTGYDAFYYQTVGIGGTGWRKAGAPTVNAAATVFYPEDGLVVRRQQSGPVKLVLMGAVKTGQTSVPIVSGNNFVGNVYAAPMTLQDSGIYTGDAATGLAGGSVTDADQVLIWNGSGYDVYYFQTAGDGGVGWRKVNAPAVDASSTPIPVGKSVVVVRKAANGFNWVIPQHPTTL